MAELDARSVRVKSRDVTSADCFFASFFQKKEDCNLKNVI